MAETMNIQTDVALIWGHCPIGSFRHWQVGLRWWWGGGWKKGHSLIAWQSEWSFFSPFSMTCRLWVYTNEARQTKGVQRLGPSGFLVITIALFTNDAAVATKRALLSASWRDSRCPVDNGPMPLLFARFQETVVSLRLVGRRRRFFLPPRLHNLFFYHPSLRLFSRITFCIQNRALAVKTFFGNREFLFSLFPFSERGATRLFLHPTSIGWSSVGIWIVFFLVFVGVVVAPIAVDGTCFVAWIWASQLSSSARWLVVSTFYDLFLSWPLLVFPGWFEGTGVSGRVRHWQHWESQSFGGLPADGRSRII